MTSHRMAWLGAVVLLLAVGCDSAPYDFGSIDGGTGAPWSNQVGSMIVPDPPPLQCGADGHVVASTTCPPDDQVLEGVPCESELEVCAQQGFACACLWQQDGVKRWSCHGFVNDTMAGCSAQRPADGEPCTTALSCSYVEKPYCECPTDLYSLMTSCSCGQDQQWHCRGTLFPTVGCTTKPRPSLDPGKKVADLTDAEAVAWCEWERHVFEGNALDPAAPSVEDGYAWTGGFSASSAAGLDLCWIALPHDLCAQNLKLDGCQATVAMFDDCVMTGVSGRTHGRGCGPFVLAPNCGRTFFRQSVSSGPLVVNPTSSCRIPIQ